MTVPRIQGTLRDIVGVIESISRTSEGSLGHAHTMYKAQRILMEALLSLQTLYTNTMLLPALRTALEEQRAAISTVLACYVWRTLEMR